MSQVDLDAPELFQELADLYDGLPLKDFSREILAEESDRPVVVPAANCGWSDLGNPRRVIAWLQDRNIVPDPMSHSPPTAAGGHLRVAGSESEVGFRPRTGMTTTA